MEMISAAKCVLVLHLGEKTGTQSLLLAFLVVISISGVISGMVIMALSLFLFV